MMRTYSELSTLSDYYDRFRYLRIGGQVGDETFGYDRYINQIFYRSEEWKQAKRAVKIRDEGWDMGLKDGRQIGGTIFVHHMNPITMEDIVRRNPILFDPEYLISVSFNTHQAIHYGDENLLPSEEITRQPNDTVPWK